MKSYIPIGKLLAVLCLAAALGACTGGSRVVENCDDCNEGTNWRNNEYCVYGYNTQLHCANPCLSHASCEPDHWCVPLVDQGTPYAESGVVRWVCMPKRYYEDEGRVWYWGEDNCVEGGSDECPAGMECLVDQTPSPDIYFCSDSCSLDGDCLTDCCYDTGEGAYCAPYRPYCTH